MTNTITAMGVVVIRHMDHPKYGGPAWDGKWGRKKYARKRKIEYQQALRDFPKPYHMVRVTNGPFAEFEFRIKEASVKDYELFNGPLEEGQQVEIEWKPRSKDGYPANFKGFCYCELVYRQKARLSS